MNDYDEVLACWRDGVMSATSGLMRSCGLLALPWFGLCFGLFFLVRFIPLSASFFGRHLLPSRRFASDLTVGLLILNHTLMLT